MIPTIRARARTRTSGLDAEDCGGTLSPEKTSALRRVVVEVPRQDPQFFEHPTELGVVESFRVVHLFRLDSRAYATICRVKFRDRTVHPAQLVGRIGITKVECLAQLADGAYLVNIEGKPTMDWARLAALTGGAMYPAFELTPESWRFTVVGSNDQMRDLLEELRHFKVQFKVLSIEDTDLQDPSAGSGMEVLTPKQREALIVAYENGYYDIPRRADSAEVAKALAIGKSTTLEHLRKAQKRLLDNLLHGGGGFNGP